MTPLQTTSSPRRASLALGASLALAACVPPSVVKASLGDLRTREGICAGIPSTKLLYVAVTACLRTGMAGTIYDSDKPCLISKFESAGAEGPSLADPGRWHLSVARDGIVLFADTLQPDPAGYSIGACSQYGCALHNADVKCDLGPWVPGVYTLEYTDAFNTERTGTMTITVGPGGGVR